MNDRILVVGSSNMDLSLNVYKAPEAGETVVDNGGVAYVPGGKGANAAVALARLGASVTLCAKLGIDAHGQQLYKFYRDSGMDTSAIKVDRDTPTGFAAVIKEKNGENRIIYYPGANTRITADNILAAFEKNPAALYTGFEVSFDTVLTAARVAASRGIPIFLDAAPADRNQPLESLPDIEIFSPNETETFEYTGVMPAGADSSLRAAIMLRRRVRAKYIVIKQGNRGASIYDGKIIRMIPAVRVEKVVDTTAAGDIFTAAMTLEYLRTRSIEAAVRYGVAASAISVTRFGASSSAPTAAEVSKLMLSRNL